MDDAGSGCPARRSRAISTGCGRGRAPAERLRCWSATMPASWKNAALSALSALAQQLESEPGAVLIAGGEPAVDLDLGPELGVAGRGQVGGALTGAGIVADEQRGLGGEPGERRIALARRQLIEQLLRAIEVAHGQEALDPRAEHATGRDRAVERGAGREDPGGQRRERRIVRSDRQAGQEGQNQLGVAARPERALEPALARAAEPDAVDLGRGEPLDLEAARRGVVAAALPGWMPAGPGWGARLGGARRGRARTGALGSRRRGRARLLGEQLDRALLGAAAGSPRARAPRPGSRPRGSARSKPAGSGTRRALLDGVRSKSPRDQRGNWSSGRTRSTREVGGGMSQVTRNTAPPRTMTTSRTRRTRVMVDMVSSDAPRRRRGEKVASHPDRRFISTG